MWAALPCFASNIRHLSMPQYIYAAEAHLQSALDYISVFS
jgi:hypothetical protein